jgi:hypothetical protein
MVISPIEMAILVSNFLENGWAKRKKARNEAALQKLVFYLPPTQRILTGNKIMRRLQYQKKI